jgi:prefoldin alpha subunit
MASAPGKPGSASGGHAPASGGAGPSGPTSPSGRGGASPGGPGPAIRPAPSAASPGARPGPSPGGPGPGPGRQPEHAHGPDDGPEDPRQLAAQLELVQRELARTQARLESIESAMIEANQAAATLRALADAAKDAPAGGMEVLVPVGAGVHLHARLVKDARPVVPVGAGYAIEASPEAALATVERRIQDITETFNQVAGRAEQLGQAGAQLNMMLGGDGE